jgi:phenylalanyl-tRNA synthetase beta chain
LHPGRSAEVRLGGRSVGHVGELAPAVARSFDIEGRVAIAEIDLGPVLEPASAVIASAPSVFPHVDFDLSFLVPDELPAAILLDTTKGAATDLVESARVFDEFKSGNLGEGMRALAVRYRLRAPDRTLEQSEIGAIRESMIAAASNVGAVLRGL